MGNECGLCEAANSNPKGELRPVEESNLPVSVAKGGDSKDSESVTGMIVRENSKYFQ